MIRMVNRDVNPQTFRLRESLQQPIGAAPLIEVPGMNPKTGALGKSEPFEADLLTKAAQSGLPISKALDKLFSDETLSIEVV